MYCMDNVTTLTKPAHAVSNDIMCTERNLTTIMSREWLADECIQKLLKYYESSDTIHTMVGRYIDMMIGFVCKADIEICLTVSGYLFTTVFVLLFATSADDYNLHPTVFIFPCVS